MTTALETLRATRNALAASLAELDERIASIERLEEALACPFIFLVTFSELGSEVEGAYDTVSELMGALSGAYTPDPEFPGSYRKTDITITHNDSGESYTFRYDVNEESLELGVIGVAKSSVEWYLEAAPRVPSITAEKVESARRFLGYLEA